MIRGRHRGLPVAIDRAIMLQKNIAEELETAAQVAARNQQALEELEMYGEPLTPMRVTDPAYPHPRMNQNEDSSTDFRRTFTNASRSSQHSGVGGSSMTSGGAGGSQHYRPPLMDLGAADAKLSDANKLTATFNNPLATVPEANSVAHTPLVRPEMPNRSMSPTSLNLDSPRSSAERIRFQEAPPPSRPRSTSPAPTQ